ncbi:LCM-domain-containing protein [Coniochaeta hoffmannii]|uniref:Leucine carboxyl methyltransferase 1 n=1 Tax=Coniochaeta hoffmannii TaxID=91930 RepID=A0AA38VYM1_9PEZI|nr:LCM-domain-containing protein [Coniochaeta hoffmannii]
MSAPSIPNLLSLRGASRGARGRGRGRGGHHSAAATAHDATVQGTDTDAAMSRMSAVDVGYLNDPYAKYFVSNSSGPVTRRLPIINRGTYTRTTALDILVDQFLSESDGHPTAEKQIVSLGAGTDTRCLRLLSQSLPRAITYHEVDFPVISDSKFSTVSKQAALRTILQLWCHGLDLRELAHAGDTSKLNGIKTDLPTLLISECCLCYLQTAEAEGVIKYFADRIPDLGIVLYEPVKPDDPFGRMMISNLAARGVRMPTLDAYKEPQDQETRLRDAGFAQVKVMTVDRIWDTWVPEKEKERVDCLEGLDEVEEWKLLAGHYVVAWAWRGAGFERWAA